MASRAEVTLLDRVRTGDDHAQRELFATYGETVWRILFRLLGDYDEAHDLTQETFLRAFQRAGSFQGRGSIRGWLSRIALNLARDELRRHRRRRDLLAKGTPHVDSDRPADPLLHARVGAALEGLSEVQRIVVLMHDVEGYTHEEIGEALAIAPGSSRARLSRARVQLRAALGATRKEVRE